MAQRLARQAETLVGTSKLAKHEAVYLGVAFSAAGDTARALKWLTAFTPRADMHFQLHLQRDPALAWLHDRRYSYLLTGGPR
jgi:hypothetical protein